MFLLHGLVSSAGLLKLSRLWSQKDTLMLLGSLLSIGEVSGELVGTTARGCVCHFYCYFKGENWC